MFYIPINEWTENELQEWMKCRNDIMYFIKNYVWVMVESKNERYKLQDVLYEPQEELIHNLIEKRQVIVLKSRQTGITTILSQVVQWLQLFNTAYKIGILSYKGSHQINFISKKLKSLMNYLPKCFLKPVETNNKKELVFNDLNGEVTWVQQEQPGPDSEPFTGETMNFIFVDEQQKIRNIDVHLTSILPQMTTTLSQSDEQQEKRPSQIQIVSTPKGISGTGKFFYEKWKEQNYLIKSVDFKTEGNALKDSIEQNKQTGNYSYFPQFIHWSDCGLGQEWYEKQKKILEYDDRKIKQELEQEFLGSGETYYDQQFLSKIKTIKPKEKVIKWERKDVHGDIRKGQKLINVWEYPVKGKQYVIGVDPQTKDGQDKSQIEVIDQMTQVQCQEWFGVLNSVDLQYLVYSTQLYYNSALLGIEKNQGYHLIDKLTDELGYSNIYYDKKNIGGIQVTGQNRKIIIDEISQLLPDYDQENYNFIRSKDLKEEMFAFDDIKGKQQQSAGLHDDLVFQEQYQLYTRNKQMGDLLRTSRLNEQEMKQKLTENQLQTETMNEQLFDFVSNKNEFNKDKAKELTEIMKSLNKNKVINTTEREYDDLEDEDEDVKQIDLQGLL